MQPGLHVQPHFGLCEERNSSNVFLRKKNKKVYLSVKIRPETMNWERNFGRDSRSKRLAMTGRASDVHKDIF
jgi:hypothetical protein